MIIQLVSILLLWQTTSVPYRAKDDFVVELKYNFKERPNTDKGTVNWEAHNPNGRDDRAKTGLLPYLVVNVKILNQKAEELRIRCEDNRGTAVFNKKIGKTLSYEVDMGFIDRSEENTSELQS